MEDYDAVKLIFFPPVFDSANKLANLVQQPGPMKIVEQVAGPPDRIKADEQVADQIKADEQVAGPPDQIKADEQVADQIKVDEQVAGPPGHVETDILIDLMDDAAKQNHEPQELDTPQTDRGQALLGDTGGGGLVLSNPMAEISNDSYPQGSQELF